MNSRFKHLPFKRLLQDFGVTNAVDLLFFGMYALRVLYNKYRKLICWFALYPLRPAWTNLYRKKQPLPINQY